MHIFDSKKFLTRHLIRYRDTIRLFRENKFDGKETFKSNWIFSDEEKRYDEGKNRRYSKTDIVYTLNENSFRVGKTTQNPNIVACFGCSQTFGVGLPWEETWPHVLEELSNGKFCTKNYGVSGASNDSICRLILNYLQNNSPSAIVCFFPEISRAELIYPEADNMLFSATKYIKETLNDTGSFVGIERGDDIYNFLGAYEKIFNPEYSLYNFTKNFIFINNLCNSKKIPLYWSTWDSVLLSLGENNMKHFFGDFYVPPEEELMYNSFARDNCHYGKEFHEKLAKDFYDNINITNEI